MGMGDKKVIDKSDGKIERRGGCWEAEEGGFSRIYIFFFLFSHQESSFDMKYSLPMRCHMGHYSPLLGSYRFFISNSHDIQYVSEALRFKLKHTHF